MKSVLLKEAPGGGLKATLTQLPEPKAGPGELVVEMRACGLCGTDIEKIKGHYTASMPVLGHEAVGKVVAVGRGAGDFSVGDAVFPHHHVGCHECHYCMHGSETMCGRYRGSNLDPGGFSEYFRVPQWNVSRGGVLRMPAAIDFEEASFIEPAACCIRGLERCGLTGSDSVLVVGAGPVGMIHALLLSSMEAEVMVSDIADPRLDVARRAKVGGVVDAKAEDVVQAAKAATDGRGVDCVIAATGDKKAIVQSLDAVRRGGKVLLFGVPAVGTVLDYDVSRIFNSEVSVVTTYGATEAETSRALGLISKKKVDFASLVTHTFPLDDFEKALHAANSGQAMKVVVAP